MTVGGRGRYPEMKEVHGGHLDTNFDLEMPHLETNKPKITPQINSDLLRHFSSKHESKSLPP